MICTCKPQRLEEGSSGGKTAVWSRKGTKEGTPSRLKTSNREENGRFIHKKVVFCGQKAGFGRFVHEKGVFCGFFVKFRAKIIG